MLTPTNLQSRGSILFTYYLGWGAPASVAERSEGSLDSSLLNREMLAAGWRTTAGQGLGRRETLHAAIGWFALYLSAPSWRPNATLAGQLSQPVVGPAVTANEGRIEQSACYTLPGARSSPYTSRSLSRAKWDPGLVPLPLSFRKHRCLCCHNSSLAPFDAWEHNYCRSVVHDMSRSIPSYHSFPWQSGSFRRLLLPGGPYMMPDATLCHLAKIIRRYCFHDKGTCLLLRGQIYLGTRRGPRKDSRIGILSHVESIPIREEGAKLRVSFLLLGAYTPPPI